MKNSMRMGQKLLSLFLSVFLVGWFVSCAPGAEPKDNLSGGVWPQDYVGVWENIGYGSTYKVSSDKIVDVMMNCEFEIADDNPVELSNGYVLILTKCIKGTSYTPAGQYYAIGLKKHDNSLDICCPLDYSLKFETLDALKERFNSSYDPQIGTVNYVTICTPKTESSVLVYESEYYSYSISIKKNLVTYAAADKDYNYIVDDDYTFIPKRDTSKETDDVIFYLYSEADRSQVADLVYIAVKEIDSDTNAIYYYVYDEEEDENLLEYLWDAEMYAKISDSQLEELKQMFPAN